MPDFIVRDLDDFDDMDEMCGPPARGWAFVRNVLIWLTLVVLVVAFIGWYR